MSKENMYDQMKKKMYFIAVFLAFMCVVFFIEL